MAEKYEAVNAVILGTAKAVDVDLWTLDSLWWRLLPKKPVETEEETPGPGVTVEPDTPGQLFGLERHLHEFLVDNWPATSLGPEWDLLEEDGEIIGSEYNTEEVGYIDLLAKHKSKPRWLVIELKRNQTSDATVGQVLRYMGWTQRKKAAQGETVEGLIICHEVDEKLRYALYGQDRIRCMEYRVSFDLNAVPRLEPE